MIVFLVIIIIMVYYACAIFTVPVNVLIGMKLQSCYEIFRKFMRESDLIKIARVTRRSDTRNLFAAFRPLCTLESR